MSNPTQELQQLFALLATPGLTRLRVKVIITGTLTLNIVDDLTGAARTVILAGGSGNVDLLIYGSQATWVGNTDLSAAVSNGWLLITEGEGVEPEPVPEPVPVGPCGTVQSIPYASTIVLDFNPPAGDAYKKLTLTGNVTFVSLNLAEKCSMSIKILAAGGPWTFTFPAGWIFLGAAAPANLAAGKTAVLSLTSYGVLDTDVVVAYAAQP